MQEYSFDEYDAKITHFNKTLKDKVAEAEEILREMCPEETGYQKTVFSAMNYSLMAGGKRLRPVLMMETYRYFGGEDLKVIAPFMAAIEMIHTYSLIHDDLPALDNDDYRRGRLTSHKVYGEAMAILAGDALLNYAFEIASGSFDIEGGGELLKRQARSMQILTSLPGVYGMIGGQVVDVELTGKSIDEDVLKFIFKLKTGALIEACMMIGACMAGAGEDEIAAMKEAALSIGMAFQIQDDILDVTSSPEVLGKPTGSDEKNEKTTWVTLFGLEKARDDVRAYSEKAMKIIEGAGAVRDEGDTFLTDFVEWLINREK